MKKVPVLVVVTLLLLCFVIDAIAGDVEKSLSHDLSKCALIVRRLAESGRSAAVDVARLKQNAEAIHADRLLLAEKHGALAERAAALGGKAADRQDAASAPLLKKLDDLLYLLDAIGTTVTPSDLEAIKQILDILVPRKSLPLLGVLPYKHMSYPPREPASSPVVKPAYKGGDRSVNAADTAATPEAPISKEIVDLAQSLQWNPILIYEWVKNNVATEWYWGSMKGALETLRQKSGNDADQASLLVALLRASGFPSRYIKGTIEFFPDIDKARNLTGLDDPVKIHTFLQKAGIPVKPVISGGAIANFRIEHIWVETFIPYANYRGAILDDQGKIWLGLDTSIKPQGYTRTRGAGVPADILSTLRDDYLGAVQTSSPLDYLKGKLDDSLATTQPGKSWSDLRDGVTLIPEVLKIVPSGLQFPQIDITGEYQTLPDELKHRVAFSATVNSNELFFITLDAQKLSNRKVALRAEPETVEDQNLIDSFGGLDNTPAYLVRLRPVLTIDGERIIVAQDGLPMGGDYTLNIDVITPNGTERVSSGQITGNLSVIGVVSQQAATLAAIAETDDAEAILHKEAIGYIDRWNRSEDDLASLLGQRVSRPAVTIATVGAQLEVTQLMGIPQEMQWKGLFLDAGYKRIETVGRSGLERDFMRLSALQGSVLENRIFEDDLKVDSVSTAKLLQLAGTNGTSILSIDKTNVDALLSTLPFDDAVTADIANAVNQGLTVSVPQGEVAYQDWSGIGYIKEDPASGESGWMLSGQVAGGMTAWDEERWDDPAVRMVAGILMAPYSPVPNPDPESAVTIAKISTTDLQDGLAGKPLPTPLMVMVLDVTGHPVKGAAVRFSVRAGGGTFDESGSVTKDVLTDSRGIATTPFILGKKTGDNPFAYLESGKTYPTQVGDNLVDAAILSNGKTLSSPFDLLGFPGAPHHVVKRTQPRTDLVLNYAGPAIAVVEDENNNPVANSPVRFQAADATGFASCYSLTGASPLALVKTDNACFSKVPYYGECGPPVTSLSEVTDYFGSASAGVMLGSIPGARYDITAHASAITSGDTRVPSATYSYYTYAYTNQCGANTSDPQIIAISNFIYPVDTFGNSINSARSGSAFPLKARVYAMREGTVKINVQGSCGISCDKIVGNRIFVPTTDFTNSSMVFSVPDGNGSKTDLDGYSLGSGMYTANFKVQPGINKILIKGSSTSLLDRTEVCPDCTTLHESLTLTPADAIMFLYGIDIDMPSSLTVTRDANGYSLNDLVVQYTITPAEYKAQIATVVLYKNGEQFWYTAGETSGQGKGTFLKGFQFEPGSSYDVQVILNPGSGVEIKSDKVPLRIIGGSVPVQRTNYLSQFDSTVPANVGTLYKDVFQPVPVTVSEPSTITVSILDSGQQMRSVLVPPTSVSAGDYAFIVDYEQVKSAGFLPGTAQEYYIQVSSTASGTTAPHISLYRGLISERTEGRMLGQTMVHDVLIQDGSLNLTRQDFAFQGRGPQLAFSRSYSNQSSPHGIMPLGNGWSHSLDLKLRPLSTDTSGIGGLPAWVPPLKGSIFSASLILQNQPGLTMVSVNGNTFKKHNGAWYSERGRHGTLEEFAASGTNPAGFRFTAKDGTRYIYNSTTGEMPVTRIEDRNGNTMSFTYDGQLLSKVTDAVGRSCNFSYETLAAAIIGDHTRLSGVACSDGVELAFTYDPHGYLKTAKRGARAENYEYALENGISFGEYNLTKATDVNQHSFVYDYYTQAELPLGSWNAARSVKPLKSQDVIKSVTYPGDGPTPVLARFAYDVTTANKRTVTDLRGYDTTYTLNYYGNPLLIEEPVDDSGASKTTKMTWSIDEGRPDNVMTSKTNSRLFTTYYEYDAKGNIVKETDPYGKFITTSWNQKYSQPESRTDRNNNTRTWQYDPANGNLLFERVQERDNSWKETAHTYYPTGERWTTRDPRNKTTTFTYDSWGNPASVKGHEGSLIKYEYDIRGRQRALIDPNTRRTEYAYDALDYPSATTYPQHDSYALATGSGRIKTQTHDPIGNLLTETDRLGLTLTYSYTARNQVKSITRTGAGIPAAKKKYTYDNNGNLLTETDWKEISNSSPHVYDKLNRRVTTYDRLGFFKKTAYDLNGNPIEETDAEGRVTDHEYDKLDRLTRTVQPALPGQPRGELKYTYYDEADPKTNLKSESDQETYTTYYECNARYQRTKRTNAMHGLDGAYGIHTWEYDDSGNLERETDEEQRVVRHEYDGQNRLTADVRSHDGREIRTDYGYDPTGNRISVTDQRRNLTEMKYDEWNRLWQVITSADPVRYVTTTELDGEGNKVRTIDANSFNPGIRRWIRDPRGLVTNAFDAEEKETRYGYDKNNNNDEIIYANGSTTRIAYDAEDRKGLVTEALGQPEERSSGVILYDKVGNPLQVKDGNGRIRRTEYNALNLPWKNYDPAPFDSRYVETTYYRTGKVKSVTNRRGKTTGTEYDRLWRVTLVTDPLTKTIKTTYDNVGNVRTVKDKRDIISETLYDDLHRPKEKKRANLTLFTYEYDDNGNLASETDAEQKKTIYGYNKRNLKDKVTYFDSTSRSMLYDGNGNLKTETDEELIDTSYGYDRENRLTATERAGETTWKNYDDMGDLQALINPKGNSRTYGYDKLRRLTGVTDDPFGPALTTDYKYDKNNNLKKTTDVRGNIVENDYDELNRITRRTQRKAAGDLVTSFDMYDEEGNLIDLTDPKGQKQHHTYDELNRRTISDYTDTANNTLTVTTGYDANNNVTNSSSPSDSTVNIYDDFDRLKMSTQRGTTVSYDYYDNGNRKSVSVNNNSTGYTYDERNRVKTATAGTQVTSFDYYKDGKKKTASYPNGAKEEYDYHPTNRVKTATNNINGTQVSKFEYGYDDNGNRKTQNETRGTRNIVTAYDDYDTLDRMTGYSVTENGSTTHTGYTFEGYNRKTETTTRPDNTSTTRTYNYDETDWLTQITDGTKTIGYTYDNNGNTTKKADSTDPGSDLAFDYDARDKLTRTSKGATILGRNEYNANGYRIRQLNSDRGDVEYLYDGTAVIEERNATGLLAHYRYANKLYNLFDGTVNQYYHQDALESTTDLTDDAGATKASYFLNPWGMIVDSIGNSVNRRVFTGKEFDQNTGLIYFGARYYDPDTARFTTQDTYLGEQATPPSLHKYLYAYSNPTVYIDLEGYYSWQELRSDTCEAIKNAVDPLGIARGSAAIGLKGLDYVSKDLGYLERKVDDNYEKRIVGRGNTAKTTLAVKATMDKLPLTVVKGLVDTPKHLRDQANKFVEDPTFENVPVLGEVGKNLGVSSARFAEKKSFENGIQVWGAFGQAFLTVAPFLPKGPNLSLPRGARTAAPEAGLLGEPVSGEPVADVRPIKAGGADFYVNDKGEALKATAYRYMDSQFVDQVMQTKSAPLSHFGFDEFGTGASARDAFQIFYEENNPASWSDARLRGKFDTLQLFDKHGNVKVKVPMEKGGMGSIPEPITKYYSEYGKGGYPQLVPKERMKVNFDNVDIIPEK